MPAVLNPHCSTLTTLALLLFLPAGPAVSHSVHISIQSRPFTGSAFTILLLSIATKKLTLHITQSLRDSLLPLFTMSTFKQFLYGEGLAHTISKLFIRFLQFVLGLTVAGIYGNYVRNQSAHNQPSDPSFVFGLVVGGLSCVTAIVYSIPKVKAFYGFVWDCKYSPVHPIIISVHMLTLS